MPVFASSILALVWLAWLTPQGAPAAQEPAPEREQEQEEVLLERRTFEQKLAAHRHFSKLAFERVESRPPYVFLVQKTAREDPERPGRLADQLVEMLAPVLARFEHEVVEPLALAPRDEPTRFTLVLLASRGDLDNYASLTGSREHLGAECYFERGLPAVVLFEDAFGDRRTADERVRSARHGFVHACQQAWHAGDDSAALDSWLLEGMADAWSRRAPVGKKARIDQGWLRAFAADALAEGPAGDARRWVALRTFAELEEIGEPSRLMVYLRTRTPQGAELDLNGAWWKFFRQASLAYQFLEEAGEGRHRALLSELLRAAMAGAREPGPAPPALPATLDAEFLAWVSAAHRAQLPGEKLDAKRFEQALARGSLGAPLLAAEPGAPGAPVAPPSAPAPALDLSDATTDERLALALHELAHGSMSRAVAALEALERDTLEAAPRERARRELERARAWMRLCEADLRARITSGKPLEFTAAGRKHKAKVLALEGDTLHLEKNRSGVERLALGELDALELARDMEPAGSADDWARYLPYVLRGDARARKLLAGGGAEASALARDSSEDYPARLRLGAAAARLAEFAARSTPATPDETSSQLDELAAWKAEFGDLALAQRKSTAVQGRARTLLARRIELLGPSSLLAGKLEVLEDENLRISWDFDDLRELADFSAANYPPLARKALGDDAVEDVPFHLEGGRLVAAGQASLRTLVDLGAPLSVRYSLEFLEHEGGDQLSVAVGLCDDGREHFLWAVCLGHLRRYDEKDFESAKSPSTSVFMNTPYAVELRHDGARLEALVEGQLQSSLPTGERRSGAVFLCCQSDFPVRIERLEVEGRLLPGSFERLARAWVERELARY